MVAALACKSRARARCRPVHSLSLILGPCSERCMAISYERQNNWKWRNYRHICFDWVAGQDASFSRMKHPFLPRLLWNVCAAATAGMILSTLAHAAPEHHHSRDRDRARGGPGDRDWALTGSDAQDEAGTSVQKAGSAGALNQGGAGGGGAAGAGAEGQAGASAQDQGTLGVQSGERAKTPALAGYDKGIPLPILSDPPVRRRAVPIPAVPEANAGLVLIPFVGAVLLFSSRRLWRAKPSVDTGHRGAPNEP